VTRSSWLTPRRFIFPARTPVGLGLARVRPEYAQAQPRHRPGEPAECLALRSEVDARDHLDRRVDLVSVLDGHLRGHRIGGCHQQYARASDARVREDLGGFAVAGEGEYASAPQQLDDVPVLLDDDEGEVLSSNGTTM
jgi:hypothetical protein